MAEIEIEERGDVILHGRPAHSMAVHEKMGKIIVSRKDVQGPNGEPAMEDTIEQYNILTGWLAVPEKVISPNNGGIESVCFVNEKIVASHLNGSITIADPHSDNIKRVQIAASQLWAICPLDSTRAAMVSHSAQLFTVDIENATVLTTLAMGIDKRLLSITARNDVIAVGANDGVLIVHKGAIKHTLRVERKEARLPTLVWSLCFVKENILASGDSRGIVSFWNTNTGMLLGRLESHQADVLSLCISDSWLYAAGVDPRIMAIKEVNPGNYQVVQTINGPVRDVKALASYNDMVYAAGDDHELFVAKKYCRKIAQQTNKDVFVSGEVVMVRGQNFVDIWTTAGKEEWKGDTAIVKKQPSYLARVYTPEKAPLLACDLSVDGSLFALSSSEYTTVYLLNPKKGKKAIAKLEVQPRSATAIRVMKSAILLCSGDFEINMDSLEGNGTSQQILNQEGSGTAVCLAVSSCERYAAVITSRSQVFVIDLRKGESRLLRVELPIDIAFTDGGSLFVLSAPGSDKKESKKVLHEFPAAGGAVKRSAGAMAIFGTNGVRAVGIAAGEGDRLIVISNDERWVVINKTRDEVLGPLGVGSPGDLSPVSLATSTALNCSAAAVKFRTANRVCACRLTSPEPLSAPFKLHKFGHQ